MIKTLLLLIPLFLSAKTLVFTTGFNRPDFIELQVKLFQKFLKDDYEFWVISDANNPIMRSKIENTCARLGVHCENVPQSIHNLPYLYRSPGDNYNNPNVRHCNSVQWAWNNFFSKHDGPVMVIDSDMFPVRPFSVAEMVKKDQLAGVFWSTEDLITKKNFGYLWLALIMFNNATLPDRGSICFNCGYLPGTQTICDSGGWTGLYLQKYKGIVSVLPLSYKMGFEFFCPYRYAPDHVQTDKTPDNIVIQELTKRGFSEDEILLCLKRPYTIEFLGDNQFLHYRAGTNYENYSNDILSSKDKILLEFFDRILSK